jgi:CheY-like chemotaxis protein/phosphoribosyl 1,2-cyclic phosphodiesterase
MLVRFWGTRGSIATPGPTTLRYGGNTSCVEVITATEEHFILDCGTGLRLLGLDMMKRAKPIRATILLGHTHWDHIQGFPFFVPGFQASNEFTICAPQGIGRSLANVLSGQMEYTYFPVELDQLPARFQFRELGEGTFQFGSAKVVTQFINHPAPALAYRIEADGVIIAYMCDHEPFGEKLWREGTPRGVPESILHEGDRRHASFMKHADLVIHDSQYTPEEYPSRKNWGHSTYAYAVELAAMSDVHRLLLTHHDPTHDDDFLDEIQRAARALARNRNFMMQVMCAYEGMEIRVAGLDTNRIRSIDISPSVHVAGSKVRVLIVDDDPNLRLLAAAALKREGYETAEAGDGEEGLEKFQAIKPDILVLDLNMPRLAGIEALQRLRLENVSVPVLVLTAQGDENSIESAFQSGATDYLVKPFSPPQLCSRVRACMARSQSAVTHSGNASASQCP